MNAKHQKRLDQFHEEYKRAEQRLQMAIQTLQGAQHDVQAKRLRLEAAVGFLGGSGATWTYDPEKGVVIVEAKPATAEATRQNQASPPTPAQIVAKATRRQIKKELEA